MELNAHDLFTNRAAVELALSSLNGNANLKAYYRFTSGALTTDSSGNSNTLTAISDPAETTGKFAGGVLLDADDAYSIADHSSLKPTGNFSVGGWFKTTNATEGSIFQSYSQNTNIAGMKLKIFSNGLVQILTGKNTGTTLSTDFKYATSTGKYNDGQWHFAVGIWNGTNLLLYVDGNLEATTAQTDAPGYAATNYVRIGCRNNSGTNIDFIGGTLDDVFLFNGLALSATQVRELYGSGLKAYYRLESNANDASGNSNNLSLSGSPSYATGKFGNGLDLEKDSSQYAYISDASQTNLDISNDMSISLWAKVESLPSTNVANMQMVTKGDLPSDRGFLFYFVQPTDVLRFQWASDGALGTTTAWSSSAAAIVSGDLGTWVHFVAVVNAATKTVTLYKNGSAIAGSLTSDGGATTIFNSAGDFRIGTRDNAGTKGEFFDGVIDDVAIFNKQLTSTEVSELYNIKAWTKALTDTATLSEVMTKSSTRSLSDVVTLSESFLRAIGKNIVDSFSGLVDSIETISGKGLEFEDQVSLTDSIQKDTTRELLDSVVPVESFSTQKSMFSEFTDSFSGLVDTMTSIFGRHKELTDTITTTDQISKSSTRSLSDTTTLSDQISHLVSRVKSFIDNLTLSETIVKSRVMARPMYDTLTISDSIIKYLNDFPVTKWLRSARATVVSFLKTAKATSVWTKTEKPNDL